VAAQQLSARSGQTATPRHRRLPLGDFTAVRCACWPNLAEAYGDGSMRLTVDQNVALSWVKTSPSSRSISDSRPPASAPDAGNASATS
jgi:hypothetical protein